VQWPPEQRSHRCKIYQFFRKQGTSYSTFSIFSSGHVEEIVKFFHFHKKKNPFFFHFQKSHFFNGLAFEVKKKNIPVLPHSRRFGSANLKPKKSPSFSKKKFYQGIVPFGISLAFWIHSLNGLWQNPLKFIICGNKAFARHRKPNFFNS